MSLVLAHVTGVAHNHGDLFSAVLGVLLVLAVALAPTLWQVARRAAS